MRRLVGLSMLAWTFGAVAPVAFVWGWLLASGRHDSGWVNVDFLWLVAAFVSGACWLGPLMMGGVLAREGHSHPWKAAALSVLSLLLGAGPCAAAVVVFAPPLAVWLLPFVVSGIAAGVPAAVTSFGGSAGSFPSGRRLDAHLNVR